MTSLAAAILDSQILRYFSIIELNTESGEKLDWNLQNYKTTKLDWNLQNCKIHCKECQY